MDQYPTEEEEFELQYGDELDAMDDMEMEMTPATPGPSRHEPPRASTSFSNYSRRGGGGADSPHLSQINEDSPLRSPALSQIPRNASTTHKRLFGTPGPSEGGTGQYGRMASTPFPGSTTTSSDPLTEIQNIGLNPRKRRLDALFGDIQDIEDERSEYNFGGQDYVTKKSKTEEQLDHELIDKILEARKQFQEVVNPTKSSGLARVEALHRFKMQNLSYTVPKWPFATIVRSDKERVYVRFHSEDFETKEINEINCFKDGYNGLLGEAKERIWNEAKEIIAKRYEEPVRAIEPNPEVVIVPDNGSVLWVEKYRPKRYIDLLSDETTNRSLLQWLKLWDKVVFNREPKQAKDTKQLNSFNKKTGRFESGGWKKKGRSTLNTELDEHGRPMQKIALLCGPPGLGKTTLAHTIARHAGYVVREVNASDDRSPEAFRIALESGTQMRSVLNQDGRPNCIILDEIDGAPLATIEFLLRFISGAVPVKGGAAKKGKGEKADKFILKRPIICICNDMYVPALRQLRQIAFVVNFPPTECARLAERLLLIAKQEKIQTDLTSMLALADKTGNDVRACLSMLQFHSSLKKPLRLTDVLKSNVGQKDRHKGLFGIWSAIFQIQRHKKMLTQEADSAPSAEAIVTLSDMSPATRMVNVLDVLHMAGDYDRLMQGVFENYLLQKMPDPNMVGVAEAGEWFCFNDRVQQMINHQQNYSIYPYLTYGFVVWHYLFAGLAWPKINFPTKGYENSQKLATCKLILTGLRKGLSAQLKGIGEGPTVLLDTVPLLKRVISPSLRSVSLQLLTPKEKSDLTHTVEVMADFGLNYIQLKSAEGTYQYQLDPDLEQLGQFQGVSPQNLSYFGKQIVAREVELEQMRRAQPKAAAGGSKVNGAPAAKKKDPPAAKDKAKAAALPNHLQTLQPKQITSKVKQVVKYRQTYTEAEVSEAVDRVRRQVMGINQAARHFGVPRSTIRSRTKMNVQNVVRSGPQSVLTPEEESQIEKWIFDMQRRGFPVTPDMLIGTVQEILNALPRQNPFKNNCPGKKWLKLFRQRHPNVTIRTPEFITNASSKVTPEDVLRWFKAIEDYLSEQDLMEILQDPERLINGDESNFLINPKNKTVLAKRGSRNVYDIERNNSKLAVTVMFSFTASGESVPPTIIYPYKSIPSAIVQSVPSSWGIAKSDKGWMTSDVFRDYIRNVLNPYLEKRGVKKPVLYIVDGHSSHINLETSKICRELGIILIALYPNVTRIMQPADVSCFKPLKNGWPKAVNKLRRKDKNAKVTLPNFAPVLQDCIRSSLTKRTIKNGFAASGLYPWNFHAIDMTKFTAKIDPEDNPEDDEGAETDSHDFQSGSNIKRDLDKAERALQVCAEAIGPTRIKKFRSEFVCLESEEEKALFDIFQVSKDFFGRVTTKETSLSVQEGGTDTIVKSPIWYRYKEGFNNAVRKDVTLQDLM